MNIRNKYLFAIIFIMLITGCSNQPKIISATKDQVIVKAQPSSFVEAYDIAKKECLKYTKTAAYITDGTTSLEEVAFDCIGEDIEPVAEAETQTEVDAEVEADMQVEIEAETEADAAMETETDMEAESEMQDNTSE